MRTADYSLALPSFKRATTKKLVLWTALTVSGILVILTVMILGSSAQAQAGGPLIRNPANGHFYEAVTVVGGIEWFDAQVAAESLSFRGVQGHLATITSAQEHDFIQTNLPEAVTPRQEPPFAGCIVGLQEIPNTCDIPYWFGGFQSWQSPEEPEGGWQWVGGEPFVYTNWADDEPNDFDGREEDCMHPHPNRPEGWNDAACDDGRVGGYVVEYDVHP